MATNLQDEHYNDGIEEVFHRSTLGWLNQEDLVAIYNRHQAIPFRLSRTPLGPQPLEEGVFLYRRRRFRDHFEWDDVEEDRRRNCRSGPTVAGDEVTYTEASLARPEEGDVFTRRNYHRGENPFCLVHYLFLPGADDGGAGDVAAADDEADDDDGGEEYYTSSSDSSDDVDGDPDYVPEPEESEQQVNLSRSDVATLEQTYHSIHSIGYLYLLDKALTRDLLSKKGKAYDVALLIAQFINSCNAVQILLANEKFVSLCKRFEDLVVELKDPLRGGVAPLLSAVHKVQASAKCLTALHPDYLQHDILELDQSRGFYLFCSYGGIGLKAFEKASGLLYNPFYEVGNRYNDGKISELEAAVVVTQSSDLEQDKDLGLVQTIVNMVQTANAKEAEMHVRQMVAYSEDELINQKDGMVRFLDDPEQYKTTEMLVVMDSVIQRTIGLSKNLLAVDESLYPLYLGKAKVGLGRRF